MLLFYTTAQIHADNYRTGQETLHFFLTRTFLVSPTDFWRGEKYQSKVWKYLTWFNALIHPVHLGRETLELVVQVHHRRLHSVQLQLHSVTQAGLKLNRSTPFCSLLLVDVSIAITSW